jgi:hypothetical protein
VARQAWLDLGFRHLTRSLPKLMICRPYCCHLDGGLQRDPAHKPPPTAGGKTMKRLGSAILVAAGAALTAATLYDASMLTRALGLPVEGGEAAVTLASLSLSAMVLLLGVLGFRKRRHEEGFSRTS